MKRAKITYIILLVSILAGYGYGQPPKKILLPSPYIRDVKIAKGKPEQIDLVRTALYFAIESLKDIPAACVKNDVENYLKGWLPELTISIEPNWDVAPINVKWKEPAAWTKKEPKQTSKKPITIYLFPKIFNKEKRHGHHLQPAAWV